MPGPESNRDYLPQFEGYVRDLGVSPRHAEFFRHVYVELDAFLDRRVLHADASRFDAFLRAKVQAGLSEKRQRAYRQVLDHILSFRRDAVDTPDDELGDILEQGMGFHAAGSLGGDAPAELPGESTRAINDAPLLARSAMSRMSATSDAAPPRGGGLLRGERLSSLQGNSLYDDDDDEHDTFGASRSTTAIPDFMDASIAAEDELFDPLFDDEGPGPRDELITFDGDLPASRGFDDDLPAARRSSRGRYGDATPMPAPKAAPSRSARQSLSSFDDDDLPAAGGAAAAPWASASSTRELTGDLPQPRHARQPMSVEMPDSGPTRIAHVTPASGSQRPRRPVSRAQSQPTPPRPARAVEPADPGDPLGLFGDIDLPAERDPLNPGRQPGASQPGVRRGPASPSGEHAFAQRPISALFDASGPRDSGPRPPAALLQASSSDSGVGLPAPALNSAHAGGFERRNTLKGVGAVGHKRPPSNQAVSATPSAPGTHRPTSVTDAPPGGAVAFSKLGMLEPGNGEAPIEVADDDEVAPAPGAGAQGPAGGGPMLRSVDVPSDVVARAKPIPGATESREDAMRRARKRLSKSIEKAERTEASQQQSRSRRFRPFVYDGRFHVDRPAPSSTDCTIVAPRPANGLGSVLKLAVLPLTLAVVGVLLLLLGLTAGLGSGPLATLGVGGWAMAGVGLVLAAAFGLPVGRWLSVSMRPLRQNTPDATLRSYHEALWAGNVATARRCLALSDEAPPLPDDFDVRQKRQIGDAFNQLDAATFERYWFIQHPLARVGGFAAMARRGRPGELGETRLVAGSVDSGAVLLLVELPDKQHYWLVPQVRVEGLWYLVDGQLYWRAVEAAG